MTSTLPQRLRTKADMINMGERIEWGSDTALMDEAADYIEWLEQIPAQAVEGDAASLVKLLAEVDDTVGGCCDCIRLAADKTLQPRVDAAIKTSAAIRKDVDAMNRGAMESSPNPFAEALAQMHPVRVMTVGEIAKIVENETRNIFSTDDDFIHAAKAIASLGTIRVEG